jgi:acetoin utilization deacetylase AcuC-like enzyme
MKIFYDPVQKNHVLTHEIISGKRFRHHEKRSRIDMIVRSIKAAKTFDFVVPEPVPREVLATVHDADYLCFLEASERAAQDEIIWPYVFPCDSRIALKNPANPRTAGNFCFDVGTPIMRDTWSAANAAASGAYAAACQVARTGETAYALARPPGHHASQNKFGGYCYLNNAAIAARYLSQFGKVLLVDFDFHHGNGTQSIFYDTSDVFYMSLHADPTDEYPYFTGHADERGVDEGFGFNLNIPLEKYCGFDVYFDAFRHGIDRAFAKIQPDFLVISAGFDIANLDPLGHFGLSFDDFHTLGREFRSLNRKTVIVQEGGYLVENLGRNVESFLSAFL